MVIDLFNFAGEYDLLEIRFNILDEYVDKFAIVEAPVAFSGVKKPLFWQERDKERFKKWEPKVEYLVVSDFESDAEIMGMMFESPLVPKGMKHYERSFYQKESGRRILERLGLDDNDVVYYGDVDEIWKPKHYALDDKNYKLRQIAYSYYLNNRSPEDWRGTNVTKYKNVREGTLNAIRADQTYILNDGGWHFTNMGGHDAVIRKLEWYDHQEANQDWVKGGLALRIAQNRDFLNRPFKFWVDESELPEYILANKDKYKELWK